MLTVIPCARCGVENRLGTLFCRECGARLDLSQIRKPSSGLSGVALITRLVRLLVLLVFLTTLALLVWPQAPLGDRAASQGARVVDAKIKALRGAIMRGNEVVEEIEEADLNAHFMARLVRPVPEDGAKPSLREVRANLKPEGVQVWLKAALGPLPITYTTEVTLHRQADGHTTFSAGTVQLGHFPMIGPLRQRALKQFSNLFAVLNEERAILNAMPQVVLQEGSIALHTAR